LLLFATDIRFLVHKWFSAFVVETKWVHEEYSNIVRVLFLKVFIHGLTLILKLKSHGKSVQSVSGLH